MSEPIEGYHYCWRTICEKCGKENAGCIRFNVRCYACNEYLPLTSPYHDLLVSPEAVTMIRNWLL